MKLTNAERKRIQQKITDTHIPLKKLIFEDNGRKVDIAKNFTNYSHVLASVELIIHSFITANPDTNDHDILHTMKTIRKDPFHEFSHSEEDALAFAIIYGMSRGLQQKRLTINEVHALLDWLIHEVEGRMQKEGGYTGWLREFFRKDNLKQVSRA